MPPDLGGPAETVGTLRRRIARDLTAAFAERGHAGTPALDARLLVGYVLALAPSQVPLHDDDPVGAADAAAAVAMAARRAAGEPVGRILGHREFHGHDLILSPDTLEPRPDTETLVDAALDLIPADRETLVADLGTGTGAILLSVLAARPLARGIGVDRAPGAVATARENARRLGLADRALFVVGDWMSALGTVDYILSNPPYIGSDEIAGLDAEVRLHDPRLALDGGPDGLDAVRAILADLPRVLAPNGAALIEIGKGQADAAAVIAVESGLRMGFRTDLAGILRVAVVERA
jgi:release factor glutamine methyltransferase